MGRGRREKRATITTQELALKLGVSPRTVSLLVADGMPRVKGGRGQNAAFDEAAAVAWYLARQGRNTDPGHSVAKETAQLKAVQRRKTELEIAAREGELLPIDDVRRVWQRRMEALRAGLIMLAPQAVQRGIVAAERERELQDLVEDLMRELAAA